MRPLTARQLAFVEAYSADGNAARAARAAGYAGSSAKVIAHRLTKDNRIAAEIAKQRAANAEKLEITKEQVLAQIVEAINMARDQQNPAVMIGGCVQLAKLCGFFEPEVLKVRLSTDAEQLQAKLVAMSDEELYEIVASAQ